MATKKYLTKQEIDLCYTKDSWRGKGAFGNVHVHKIKPEFENTEYRKSVIVKSIDEMNSHSADREANNLKKLSNQPYIVQLLGFERFPFKIYMECLNTDLATFVSRRKFFLTRNDIFKIYEDILKGLKCLEELGILHRDIKAANILVDYSGSDGSKVKDLRFKIGDFGGSRPVNVVMLKRGDFPDITKNLGTPGFMAPEIISLEGVDDTVGQYGAGVDIWGAAATIIYAASRGMKPLTEQLLRELRFDVNTDARRDEEIYSKIRECVEDEVICSILGESLKWNPLQRNKPDQSIALIDYLKKHEIAKSEKKHGHVNTPKVVPDLNKPEKSWRAQTKFFLQQKLKSETSKKEESDKSLAETLEKLELSERKLKTQMEEIEKLNKKLVTHTQEYERLESNLREVTDKLENKTTHTERLEQKVTAQTKHTIKLQEKLEMENLKSRETHMELEETIEKLEVKATKLESTENKYYAKVNHTKFIQDCLKSEQDKVKTLNNMLEKAIQIETPKESHEGQIKQTFECQKDLKIREKQLLDCQHQLEKTTSELKTEVDNVKIMENKLKQATERLEIKSTYVEMVEQQLKAQRRQTFKLQDDLKMLVDEELEVERLKRIQLESNLREAKQRLKCCPLFSQGSHLCENCKKPLDKIRMKDITDKSPHMDSSTKLSMDVSDRKTPTSTPRRYSSTLSFQSTSTRSPIQEFKTKIHEGSDQKEQFKEVLKYYQSENQRLQSELDSMTP